MHLSVSTPVTVRWRVCSRHFTCSSSSTLDVRVRIALWDLIEFMEAPSPRSADDKGMGRKMKK